MTHSETKNALLVYDGHFFRICRRYYRYSASPKLWLNVRALGTYLQMVLADELGPTYRGLTRIVEQHLYIGQQSHEHLSETAIYEWAEYYSALSQAEVTVHGRRAHLNGEGGLVEKGVDLELALDTFCRAVVLNPEIDVVILVTGDADFVPLIQQLARYKKETLVVGFEFTGSYPDGSVFNAGVSAELKRAATWYLDLGHEIQSRGKSEKMRALFAPDQPPARALTTTVPAISEASIRQVGTVVPLPVGERGERRNFAFLVDSAGINRYFRADDLNGLSYSELTPGLRVIYTPCYGSQGRLAAKNVTLETGL
jgi:uncharacterized LabA/DUF88 family protein